MEALTTKKSIITAIFREYEGQFNSTLSCDLGEHLLRINDACMSGTIKGLLIGNRKLFLEFDIICNKDTVINLLDMERNPVHFLYCKEGTVVQGFENSLDDASIDEFQTAIILDKKRNSVLRFKAGTHIKVAVISVCQLQNTISSPLTENIHSLFTKKLKNNSFRYIGSYNLKIAEQFFKLNDSKHIGLVKKLYIEGVIQLILAMEIQHHQDDIKMKDIARGSLNKREQKIIRDLANYISNNIDTQYTINLLTEQTGISAAKLQEGFKKLFGRTVSDFIKNKRVEAAEKLIKTMDLTISEIVYTVGLSSRSYFSKIFREKYKCSPKVYQDSFKSMAIPA